MEEFDLTGMADAEAMGFGSSKCALALKEKLNVFQSMLDIFDTLEDPVEISEGEFFHQGSNGVLDQTRQPPARTKGSVKAVPAAKKQKKQTRA
jgi:hypothetical protein